MFDTVALGSSYYTRNKQAYKLTIQSSVHFKNQHLQDCSDLNINVKCNSVTSCPTVANEVKDIQNFILQNSEK